MLIVLVIFKIYQVHEGQKRTVTGGSDAQQNASYGLFMIGRDISIAGNGIASSAAVLDGCALLRPIPVVIAGGATDNDPTRSRVLRGLQLVVDPSGFLNNATIASASSAGPYQVPSPVGFSPNDLIVAVRAPTARCPRSTQWDRRFEVPPAMHDQHTRSPGNMATTYNASMLRSSISVTGGIRGRRHDGRSHRLFREYGHRYAAIRTSSPRTGPSIQWSATSSTSRRSSDWILTMMARSIRGKQHRATGLLQTCLRSPLATLQQIRAVRDRPS